MRLYTFTNFYLSSIQQGIQPLHVTSELFVKYPNELRTQSSVYPDAILQEWAKNHKTVVCLNGGNNADLNEIWVKLNSFGLTLNLPFAKFHEDEQSLGGVVTSMGIVVPTEIYEFASKLRTARYQPDDAPGLTDYPYGHPVGREFAEFLNQFGLAK